MTPISISVLTICGIDELSEARDTPVSHVLSMLDPDRLDVDAFSAYAPHHRTLLRFHDIIEPESGKVMPTAAHVEAILQFGEELATSRANRLDGHLLVHCHMGVSRSTAGMLSLLAQLYPDEPEANLFERLRRIRPQAWPNSVMIGYADELLGRKGRLVDALRKHYGHQVTHRPDLASWMKQLARGREVKMAIRT
mgnify:FL=1